MDGQSNKIFKSNNYVTHKKRYGNNQYRHNYKRKYIYEPPKYNAEDLYNENIVINPWKEFEDSLNIDQSTYIITVPPQPIVNNESTNNNISQLT